MLFALAASLLGPACAGEEPTPSAAGPGESGSQSGGRAAGAGLGGGPANNGGAPGNNGGGPSSSGGNAIGVAGSAAGGSGAAGGTPVPGPSDIGTKVIHRLSNVEYDNTVHDLLLTNRKFGPNFVHEEAEGFDNIAQALSMSPRHVEDYFAAARELSAEAFADPAQRAKILTCTPSAADMTCARNIISSFGTRAFRRPLEASEQQWLLEAYQSALALGEDPSGAIEHVVHIVLSSPQFLYRIEFDPSLTDSAPHALSGYELASRLSYALWSSMPDDALFALAGSGELSKPETLRAEVDRMLLLPGAEMLIKNFAAQWLGINRLAEHAVSPTAYPDWTPAIASAAEREMELYFSEFLHKDVPFNQFLTADFNFVDGTLARHYGMTPPAEAGFTRVVDTNDQRRGLIGLAGFLTHTSRETRTSPIIRGTWILSAFMCLTLHLPPDLVVEPLPEPAEGDAPTTVRDLIATHRASAACAGCHNAIDPIGLALEHFDAIGRYRSQYTNGLAIDSAGMLPSGAMVDGLVSLTEELSKSPDFLPCAANKLNTFALGRTVMDAATIAQIVQRWTASTPTLRNLIKETVTHATFTSRRPEAP